MSLSPLLQLHAPWLNNLSVSTTQFQTQVFSIVLAASDGHFLAPGAFHNLLPCSPVTCLSIFAQILHIGSSSYRLTRYWQHRDKVMNAVFNIFRTIQYLIKTLSYADPKSMNYCSQNDLQYLFNPLPTTVTWGMVTIVHDTKQDSSIFCHKGSTWWHITDNKVETKEWKWNCHG